MEKNKTIIKLKEQHKSFIEKNKDFNYTNLKNENSKLISNIERCFQKNKIIKFSGFTAAMIKSEINPLCHSNSYKSFFTKEILESILKKLHHLGFDLSDNNINNTLKKENLWTQKFEDFSFYDLVKNEILFEIFNKNDFSNCENCIPNWKFSSFYAQCLRKFVKKKWSDVLRDCELGEHIKKIAKYSESEIINKLKEFNKKHGSVWFIKDLREENSKLYKAIFNNFEGIIDICSKAGIDYRKHYAQEDWDKEKVVSEIRKLYANSRRILRSDLEKSEKKGDYVLLQEDYLIMTTMKL